MKVRRNDCDLFRYGPDITQKEENNKTILARIAVANQDVSTINLLRCSGKAMNMEAIRTTEKSVYFYETIYQYHDIPGGWHHHIHRHDNLKSHALHPDCAFRSYFEDLQLRTSLSG